jgi:hypothetical protein
MVAVDVALGEGFTGVADAVRGVSFGFVLGGEAHAAAPSRRPVRVTASRPAVLDFMLSPTRN